MGLYTRSLCAWTLAVAGPAVASSAAQTGPDEVAAAADTLLRAGRPWQASELLDSALDRPGAPRVLILLAARAAAGWGGWTRVDALLGTASWLDSLGGEGHALLARSALARAELPAALAHAEAALRAATDSTRGERAILLARVFDRVDRRDQAAALYVAAAAAFPQVADWLLLRSASLTDGRGARQRLLQRVALPAARPRIPWADAVASERAGRWLEAAAGYDSLGAAVSAARVRLLGATTPAGRGAVRAALVALLTPRLGPAESATAIGLLDRHFRPLTAREELAVARRAAATGDRSRAVAGYAAAARSAGGNLLTDRDRFTYATALAGLGRWDRAIAQFGRVGGSLRGEAAYQRARTLMRSGRLAQAVRELRGVVRRFPADTAAAGTALYLAADLALDRGDDSAAREGFRAVGRRYPTNRYAGRALLRAALIALGRGRPRTAALELDALRLSAPGGPEAAAAAYWAGRAWLQAGDSTTARIRWTATLRLPGEYYAIRAAAELGRPAWRAPAAPAPDEMPGGEPDSAVARAALLDRLGMDDEARLERAWLAESAGREPARLRVTAAALDAAGQHALALSLARRAAGSGDTATAAVYRLLYPLPFPDALRTEAAKHGVDPLLVAALVRQESGFDPAATSRAGARGLMQILPAVGRAEARQAGLAAWDPVLLYQADVNLGLGVRHLAGVLARYPVLEHALASYNAGSGPVGRWLGTPGVADDPALFVERIPYAETRDYVRRVLANLARYRGIWGDR